MNYTSNCNFDFSILSFDKIIEETQVRDQLVNYMPTSQAFQNVTKQDLRYMRVNLLLQKYTRHALIMQGTLASTF